MRCNPRRWSRPRCAERQHGGSRESKILFVRITSICPVVPIVPVAEPHAGQDDELLEPRSDLRMGIGSRDAKMRTGSLTPARCRVAARLPTVGGRCPPADAPRPMPTFDEAVSLAC